MYAERQWWKEAARRQLFARQGERPQKKPTPLTPWSCTSSVFWENTFLLFKPPEHTNIYQLDWGPPKEKWMYFGGIEPISASKSTWVWAPLQQSACWVLLVSPCLQNSESSSTYWWRDLARLWLSWSPCGFVIDCVCRSSAWHLGQVWVRQSTQGCWPWWSQGDIVAARWTARV